MSRELLAQLESYPSNVRSLTFEARKFITATVPDMLEMVDGSARVIGYGFGPGYADLICTIILSRQGLKLGISRSARLSDPNGLLEGSGKLHRYVLLNDVSDLRKPGLKPLLKSRGVRLARAMQNVVVAFVLSGRTWVRGGAARIETQLF